MLVAAYAESLDDNVTWGRQRLTAGVTDLCVESDIGPELIEAKSSADHQYVRQALSQTT